MDRPSLVRRPSLPFRASMRNSRAFGGSRVFGDTRLMESFLDPSDGFFLKRSREWRTSLADLARVYSAQLVLCSFSETSSTGAICHELPKKLRENFVGRCTVVGADAEADEASVWCGKLESSRVYRKAADVENPELSFRLCFWRGRASGSLEQALVCGTTMSVQLESVQESQAIELDEKDPRVRMVVAVSIEGEGPSSNMQDAEQERIPHICRGVLKNVQQRGYVWAPLAKIVWCHFPSLEAMLESLDGHRMLNVDPQAEACGFANDGSSMSFTVMPGAPRQPKAASVLRESVQRVLDVGLQDVSESSFFTACQEGDVEAVVRLLRREPKLISAVDPYGATGLICAAIEGVAEVVTELLRHGADPSATDTMGATALAAAVCTGRAEAVAVLVEVTDEREVPAGNVEAWANDAVLAPLGVEDLLATRPWDMLELAHEMVERLEAINEKELCDTFKEIARLLDLDPPEFTKEKSRRSGTGQIMSLEEHEETIAELRQAFADFKGKCKCTANVQGSSGFLARSMTAGGGLGRSGGFSGAPRSSLKVGQSPTAGGGTSFGGGLGRSGGFSGVPELKVVKP